MKTKVELFVCMLLLFCACSTPAYLPSYKEVGQSSFGAYIKINNSKGSPLKGELLAVTNDNIIVLSAPYLNKVISFPREELYSYKVVYAKGERYGWTIPVYGLISFSHGVFSIFTLPLNIIVTSILTASGQNAYSYSDNELPYEQLHLFARFPQGIPPNVNLAEIK